MQLPKETDAGTLPGKPHPYDNTQNNRNGLIEDVRASQKYA